MFPISVKLINIFAVYGWANFKYFIMCLMWSFIFCVCSGSCLLAQKHRPISWFFKKKKACLLPDATCISIWSAGQNWSQNRENRATGSLCGKLLADLPSVYRPKVYLQSTCANDQEHVTDLSVCPAPVIIHRNQIALHFAMRWNKHSFDRWL